MGEKIVRRDAGVKSLSATRSAGYPRPEPFDRLKALSSIDGLGSKTSHGIHVGESKGSVCSQHFAHLNVA